jgi:hypothetical protein
MSRIEFLLVLSQLNAEQIFQKISDDTELLSKYDKSCLLMYFEL